MTTTEPLNTPIDPDERIVEEVHCIYTGVPISSIPSWYANVNVRFFSEAAKPKSPALAPAPIEVPVAATEDGDESEAPLEDDIDDLEIDEADLDDETDDPDTK